MWSWISTILFKEMLHICSTEHVFQIPFFLCFFFPFSLLLICPVWSQYSKGQLTFSCCPQRQTFSRYCSNPTISKLHPLSPKIPLGLSTEASPCKYVHRTDPRTLQQAENIWVLLTGLEQEGENALKVAPVFPVDLKGMDCTICKSRAILSPLLQMQKFALPVAKQDLRNRKQLWTYKVPGRKTRRVWHFLGWGPQWTPEWKFS